MFSTMLPILPPPATSLLPPLHAPNPDTSTLNFHPQHQHQRRQKHVQHGRSAIHSLSLDERTIGQRKLAIAMYGYSWLKPAGCNKTMLGRREEELEREEVERQLREVELQERIAAEGEREAEAERLAEMRRLEMEAEAGGASGLDDGERDLDDDIPEADDGEEEEEEENEDETAEEEEDMEGDLDDEIPDADAAGESSWVYDTNRDPDTDSEDADDAGTRFQRHRPPFIGLDDPAEAQAMVNAMLDEDELGEFDQRNLDDDVPDMDDDDMDMDMDNAAAERDLDEDVPEAEDDDEWQHTDTELEESDMDISILPQQVQYSKPRLESAQSRRSRSSGIGPGTTHEEMRRTSGNMVMPPPQLPLVSASIAASASHGRRPRDITPQYTRAQYHTPGIDTNESISNLISSNASSVVVTGPGQIPVPQDNRRNWLNPSAARRNLFSGFTRSTTNNTTNSSTNSTDASGERSGFTPDALQDHQQRQQQHVQTAPNSSGGLFTPSPRVVSGTAAHLVPDQGATRQTIPEPEEPRSRTRSGRLLGGIGIGSVTRRGRRGQE